MHAFAAKVIAEVRKQKIMYPSSYEVLSCLSRGFIPSFLLSNALRDKMILETGNECGWDGANSRGELVQCKSSKSEQTHITPDAVQKAGFYLWRPIEPFTFLTSGVPVLPNLKIPELLMKRIRIEQVSLQDLIKHFDLPLDTKLVTDVVGESNSQKTEEQIRNAKGASEMSALIHGFAEDMEKFEDQKQLVYGEEEEEETKEEEEEQDKDAKDVIVINNEIIAESTPEQPVNDITLRPYQSATLQTIEKRKSESHRRHVIEAPTDSGKTIMACFYLLHNLGLTLYFVPTFQLALQTLTTCRKLSLKAVIVCSETKGKDDVNDEQIMKNIDVVVTVYNSAEHVQFLAPKVKTVIRDECHHMDTADATAGTYRSTVLKICDEVVSNDGNVLDFSATPTGPDVSVPYDLMLELGHKVPLELVVIVGNEEYCAKRTQERCNGESLMTFSNNVKNAQDVAKIMNDVGRKAVSVTGETKDRDAIVKQFEAGEINTLCVCGMLVEGFDSTVDHAVFPDLVGSEIRARQGSGRIRKYVGRVADKGLVIIYFHATEEDGELKIPNVDMATVTQMFHHLRTLGSDMERSIDEQSFQIDGMENTTSTIIKDGVTQYLRKAAGIKDFTPKLQELIAFHDEHKRLPSRTSEEPLYLFMVNCAGGTRYKREYKVLIELPFFKDFVSSLETKKNQKCSKKLRDILKVPAKDLNVKQRKYLTNQVYNAGHGKVSKPSYLLDYNFLKENYPDDYFKVVNSRVVEKNAKIALDKDLADASKLIRDKNTLLASLSDTAVLLWNYIATNKKMPNTKQEMKLGDSTWKFGKYAANVKQAKNPSAVKDKCDLKPVLPDNLKNLLEPNPVKRKTTTDSDNSAKKKKTKI